MFGVMKHLDIVICDNAQDAIDKGFNYEQPKTKAIQITKVVIVRNGTVAGNSTVDLVLEDETGQQFVVMVTANLLKSLPL